MGSFRTYTHPRFSTETLETSTPPTNQHGTWLAGDPLSGSMLIGRRVFGPIFEPFKPVIRIGTIGPPDPSSLRMVAPGISAGHGS